MIFLQNYLQNSRGNPMYGPVVKYPNFDQKWAPNIGIMQNTQTHISRHIT